MSAPLRAPTAAGAAPRPAPRRRQAAPEPRPVPIRRPPLRLVDDSRVVRAARQRRRRRLLAVAAVSAGLAFVALAAAHAHLVTNQDHIDELRRQVEEAQVRHQELRLQVASLEAPSRIVEVATERLGMVPAETVTPLPAAHPTAPAVPAAAVQPAPASPGPGGPARSWGAMKPYLGRDA